MKRRTILLTAPAGILALCIACNESAEVKSASKTNTEMSYGGFASAEKWGEHLVTIASCHDCHSPKKMTPMGPDVDSSRLLSGHPSDVPDPDINRQDIESKGLVVSSPDLTAWAGPWGVSYTANLTSDSTGIGTWKESQFIYAIRNGKFKGLSTGRNLLPPMPWPMYRNMTDEELKAVFVYLKSTKPIRNVVQPPKPPVAAGAR